MTTQTARRPMNILLGVDSSEHAVAANKLVGVLSREQVLHYLRVRSELGL
jgi:hypothetical protein